MTRVSFSRIIADAANSRPHDIVVVDDDGVLTAEALDREATSLAHALIARGVQADDVVAVALPNGRDFVIACAAIWRAGATPQPISPGLAAAERARIEELGAPRAAIGAPPVVPGIVWFPGVQVDADSRPLPDLAATCWKAAATSGSTGRPKIVRAAAPALLDPDLPVAPFLPHSAVQLVAGPLWHSAVFTYAFRGMLTGHRLIIMGRFDARRWVELVETHQVTWGLLVPTMMSRLMRLSADERDAHRVRSLDSILHMGAPCAPTLKRSFIDWLGPERVDEVYAGSESNGLTRITGIEWLAHPGSVGRGISGTRIRIRDERGDDLPAGLTGAIWMHRGEAAAYDYVGASSRRDDDGWDTLGDLGRVDGDGYLYIEDRADDVINRGGDKIAPATIEAVLESCPHVLEAVAFGVPDCDLGQIVHAAVRLDDDDRAAEVLGYAREVLGFRAPVELHPTRDPLRNEAGKIRRGALRERFVAD